MSDPGHIRTPAAREVHLWTASPSDHADPAERARLAAWLDEEECRRMAAFRFQRDRQLYLVAHALLRSALSACAPVAPAQWRFREGVYGRPEIAVGGTGALACGLSPAGGGWATTGVPPLRFSLSHTHGLAFVAVTLGCDVGADAEHSTRELELTSIAKRFFSPRESADVLACPESERTRRFFSYWTLKESYLKALGFGLQRALDSFTFVPTVGGFQLAAEQPDRGEWQFALLDLTSEHLGAVAVRSREAVAVVPRGGLHPCNIPPTG